MNCLPIERRLSKLTTIAVVAGIATIIAGMAGYYAAAPSPLRAQRSAMEPLVILAMLSAVGGAGAIWIIRAATGRIVGPLAAVADAAYELVRRGIDPDAPPRALGDSAAEIEGLIGNMRALGDRLTSAERRMRDDAATMAHELRTPLAVLKSRVLAMVDGIYVCDHQNCAALVPQIDRLTRLVDDLRTLSLVQSDAAPLELANVDLAQLTVKTLGELRHLMAESGVRVEINLEPVSAMIDAARIGLVLTNIIRNVLQHSGPGCTIRVELRYRNREAILEFAYDGTECPDQSLEELFQPFERMDNSPPPQPEASGLCLTIVRAIIDRHKGRVAVARSHDGGGCLSVIIPNTEPIQAASLTEIWHPGDQRPQGNIRPIRPVLRIIYNRTQATQ